MTLEFRRALGYRLRSLFSPPQQPQFVAGLPGSLHFDDLADIVYTRWGERLQSVSHLHLSSWKAAGAFRLILGVESGSPRSMIFKNALYTHQDIPALQDLPIHPGPPEYYVYAHADAFGLEKYVPEVYFCAEIIPQVQYSYLLEDLSETYKKPRTPGEILNVVQAQAEFHRALRDALPSHSPDEFVHDTLLRFDHVFSNDLREYASHKLGEYISAHQDAVSEEFWRLWPEIAQIHAREEFFHLHSLQQQPLQPIHGDLNNTNIWVHRENPHQIKYVDWEWAGLGMPHADLVSLLKFSLPRTERKAIRIFAHANPRLSLAEHNRLYQWCRLERGLLDASFLAAQAVSVSDEQAETAETQMDFPHHVRSALKRVLSAYRLLT